MANKAIDGLLKYGSIGLNETFTTTYVPASVNTTYSNFYRNWSIRDNVNDFNGTKGQFDGAKFIASCGSGGGGQQCSRIWRNLEGYNVGRKYSISATIRSNMPAAVAGTDCIEISLFGNPTISGLIGNADLTPINFGGVSLSFQTRGLGGISQVQLLVNGTAVQTNGGYGFGATYYVWIDVTGELIEYSYSTTNSKPSTPQHTYTAASITALSNNFIVGLAMAASNNINHSAYIDDLNILLL